jgi:hypothetical protein
VFFRKRLILVKKRKRQELGVNVPRAKQQKNPNSLKNLIHEGRPSSKQVYGEPKVQRTLTVTETGWKGAVAAIKAAGYGSISDYLEKIGRGQEILSPRSPNDITP